MRLRDLIPTAGRLGEAAPAPSGDDGQRLERARAMGFDTGTVVYHGTRATFDAFSKDFLGHLTGSPSSRLGFFFGTSRENSRHYAGKGAGQAKFVPALEDLRREAERRLKAQRLRNGMHYGDGTAMLLGRWPALDAATDDAAAVKGVLIRDLRARFEEYERRGAAFVEAARRGERHAATAPSPGFVLGELRRGRKAMDVIVRTIAEYGGPLAARDTIGDIGGYYLRMENPWVEDHGHARDGRSFAAIIASARAAGHDGVIIRNTMDPGPTDVHVVFEPEQIRSVNAAFDPAKAHSANVLD